MLKLTPNTVLMITSANRRSRYFRLHPNLPSAREFSAWAVMYMAKFQISTGDEVKLLDVYPHTIEARKRLYFDLVKIMAEHDGHMEPRVL